GVVKPVLGRVLGVGPNLVEVSAEFMPGNSGSPIIHLKSGKVVGIASYASVKAFEAGAGRIAVEVRRFGYRIDSVQSWQPVNWQLYHSEAAAAADATSLTEAMYKIASDMNSGTFDR